MFHLELDLTCDSLKDLIDMVDSGALVEGLNDDEFYLFLRRYLRELRDV